ncbi:sensor histidine kinase [Leptolyngbya sp. NIES-2104]|uniref:sensor histidine kinase n=1 Tax=Leptolyngbya sp. NIES-2104 TaxID=1552121 RepID=UPI0006ECCDA7|nr:sensor histidine kinase [Leptolyngbya sp. NIES-2104]GAP94371.1 circadian input kinase A [Leptolyngbya sp. NIES-2104]
MQDFSQLLKDNIDRIKTDWADAVANDRQIRSADTLPRTAIEDHIDDVLIAMALCLSQTEADDNKAIVEGSISHGVLRANQGFDPSEIALEYHLLRKTIFDCIRAELLGGTPEEIFRALTVIDSVIDLAVSQCFKSYVAERLNELEQVRNQLGVTVSELKRLARTSEDNLSILAHELKTPLTSIIGYADLFLRQSRREERDSVSSLEHIEKVLRGGRRLLHLINDALELSRYEAGKMHIIPEAIDLPALIQVVIDEMQPLVNDRNLQLITDLEQAPQEVITDPFRLQQVITNLVSNAVRYTESGSVTIACRSLANDRWLISVTDTGIGIDPQDQLRLFAPFERVGTMKSPDSTGLGLAIVARLVELLQGNIYLASQPKEGSTFTAIFPREFQEG